MSSTIDLSGRVRVFAGRLYNHDYLWFSSTEISKVSVTLPVLHNYALSYALSHFERGVSIGSTPQYATDLAAMPLYVTPAQALSAERTVVTFNAIDSVTLRTDIKPNVNTPDLGKRVYLDPVYEQRSSVQSPAKGYQVYAFSFDQRAPRGVTRLGKKGCPIRIYWTELQRPIARLLNEPQRPSHPLNPLDVSGQLLRYEPIAIPPHLLVREAEIAHDWFITSSGHHIHVPKLVLARLEAL
jgi:CRISPR-associated protein Csc1